jgi:hypothetical protein
MTWTEQFRKLGTDEMIILKMNLEEIKCKVVRSRNKIQSLVCVNVVIKLTVMWKTQFITQLNNYKLLIS